MFNSPATVTAGQVVQVDELGEIEGLTDIIDLLTNGRDKQFYEYVGASPLNSPNLSNSAQNYSTNDDWQLVVLPQINLGTQDYDNRDIWKPLTDTNIVPKKIATVILKEAGLAKSADGPKALGGLVARNDVRSDVDAFIDNTRLTTVDGDIEVLARETATILAQDQSIISATSDAKAGVIVNNLVLSEADAFITNSTINAQDVSGENGNVLIDANNKSTIDAFAFGSVSSGDALGFTLAFNTIGWEAQDLITQGIDAIIGAPHIAEANDPDFKTSDPVIAALQTLELRSVVEIDNEVPVGAGPNFKFDAPGALEPSSRYEWQDNYTDRLDGPDGPIDLLNEDFTDTRYWRKVLNVDVFGGISPAGANAFIIDSQVSTDEDLKLNAVSETQLSAEITNASKSEKESTFAIAAKHGTSSSAAGGMLVGNKVASEARAFIDNSGLTIDPNTAAADIEVGGNLSIYASDTPGDNDVVALEPDHKISDVSDTAPTAVSARQIVNIDNADLLLTGSAQDGRSYRFLGSETEGILLLDENFEDNSRWQLLRPAGIEALLNLEVFSSASNNINALKGVVSLLGLNSYEYTTQSGTQALVGALEADPSGGIPKLIGDRVFVSSDYITAKSLTGTVDEGIYEYVGDVDTPLSLDTTDYSDEDLWRKLGNQDFEDLLFPEVGNLTDSNSTAYGGMVVMNDVRGEVEAYISEAEVSADGNVSIDAIEDASIRAIAKSTVSSSGGSALGEGTSLAAQGQIVTNLVLSSADAYVEDSIVRTSGTDAIGDLSIHAENASLLDATLLSSTQTGDTAVGISLAFNTVGWKPQNILFNAIDAILGDPLISKAFDGEEPARTQAYIINSDIDIAGDLNLDAQGNSIINATVSNAAESAASALKGASGKGYGGVLSSNKVSSDVRAFIDNQSIDFVVPANNGELLEKVRKGDWVEFDGDVYEYQGRVDVLNLEGEPDNLLNLNKAQKYATNSDWKLISNPTHSITTDIDAGGKVTINGVDNSGIHANIKLVISSVTTNDGGAAAIQETLSDIVPVDYDSGNVLFPAPTLDFGDRVRVADDHDSNKGEPGAVYRYLGAGGTAADIVTLATENYSNLDLWKIESESDIVPDGINVTDSNSLAAGGMVVVNDVRTGVDAFINETSVDAADGNIEINADQNSFISAVADSSAQSSGGGSVKGDGESKAIGGTISTNIVQGTAQAYVVDSNIEAIAIAPNFATDTVGTNTDVTQGQKVAIADGYDVGTETENLPGTIFRYVGSVANGMGLDLTAIDYENDADWVQAGDGSILIEAKNTSSLNAETKQSTTTGADAISVLVAFNSIGWKEQNILFQAIDALIGTPIGNQNPAMVSAFIENSVFEADGDLLLDAKNAATLNANITNEATAAAAAITGASAKAYAGILAANRVSSGAEAYINNTGQSNMTVDGDVSVIATDDAKIDAETLLKSITSANNDAGSGILNDLAGLLFDSYQYTESSGFKPVAFGEKVRVNDVDYLGTDTVTTVPEIVQGDVVDFGDEGTWQYVGEDNLGLVGAKSISSFFSSGNGQWVKLSGDSGRLYEYMVSIPFDFTTISEPATVEVGNVVQVDILGEINGLDDVVDLFSLDTEKTFYRYNGAVDLINPDLSDSEQNHASNSDWVLVKLPEIDLGNQNFDDPDIWKPLDDSNIVPKKIAQVLLKETGLAKSADGPKSLAGLFARNDVRSDVDAFISNTELTITDGNLNVEAHETATIVALDKSIISATSESKAGVVVNNLVLSQSDAFISDSTITVNDIAPTADQGNILIEADNRSTIDAFALGSVSSGDALGFTVAFNTIGWDAQDLLTQGIDAIIGAPHIAEANTPDFKTSDTGAISGLKNLELRDTVELDNITPPGAGPLFQGEPGKLYEWQGDAEEDLDLLNENYLDTDRWRQVLDFDVFGGVNAARANAFIVDSTVTTEGDLTLNAVSEAQLSAEISNASKAEKTSTFAIAAKHGAKSAAAGGLLVGNKTASSASAFIDNSDIVDTTVDAIQVGGDLTIFASDTAGDNDVIAEEPDFTATTFGAAAATVERDEVVHIDDIDGLVGGEAEEGKFYRFIGADAEDIDLRNENFTDSERWQQLRAAGIEALYNLEVFSSSTSNLDSLKGPVALLGLNGFEYTTSSGSQALRSPVEPDLEAGIPRLIGDRVWVSQAYIDSKGLAADLEQGVYSFTGSDFNIQNLDSTDYTDSSLWNKMITQDFEDILFPEIGNVTDSNSTAIGGMVVMNDIRGDVDAYITDAEVRVDGNADIDAIEDSSIRAIAKSTVSSSGGSAFGEGNSVARQGQIVTNLVLSEADAFIQRSSVTTEAASTGDVSVTAVNAAIMDATLLSSTQSGDTAQAITLAFNSVGWKPQNILFNAIDAILGDPIIANKAFDGLQPAHAHAYITDSTIIADKDVFVEAENKAQINATTSNAAESNASALKGASGKGFGAIISSNKVAGDAKAWIDGTSTITAGGSVTVDAQDNTGIFANTKVVSSSITTNDGGASAIQETLNDVVPVDYDTGNPLLSGPDIKLKFGDRIRLSDSFSDDTTSGTGNDGSIYQFLGDDAQGDPLGAGIDLANADYTNLDLFKEELETNLVPQGFNISDSNSQAIGGLIVMNDVRAEVEAYIDGADVTANNGNISVTAVEDATLKALTDGTVISSGGSALGEGESLAINGVIATNVVQSMAKAYARNNTLIARDNSVADDFGNILIDAKNESNIDATTEGATQSGDTAVGVLLAFNSVGWKSSNLLFNAVDALLGDPLISDAFDGAGNGAVEAFLENVFIEADGDLDVLAKANSTITATLSNDATSAAAALKGAEGKAVAIALGSNKVNSSASAYIDNSGLTHVLTSPLDPPGPANPPIADIRTGGSVNVKAMDTAIILADSNLKADSSVTNDFGASAVGDLADSLINSYAYTTKSGEQDVFPTEKVFIASDYAVGTETENRPGSIFMYVGSEADGLGLDLATLDYSDLAATTDDWIELNPVDFATSDSGQPKTITPGIAILDFLPPGALPANITGTVVRVAPGHDPAKGEVGANYRYIGGSNGILPGDPVDIDLSIEDFTDTDNWVQISGVLDTVLDSTLVDNLNLNVSDSNSTAVGGLVVMNDVRSDVDAYIESSILEADGDLLVEAIETATILATDKSVVTSDGGSITGDGNSTAINGVIATNLVLSDADAEVRNSDIDVDGTVDVKASNTSTINAIIESTTESKGTSVGATLAFNSIGWKSQNFLFNSIDALLGTNIGDQQPAGFSAKILNSDIVAGESIDIDVLSNANIDARVLNSATSIVATVGESEAISVGAIITMNKISTEGAAVIDGSSIIQSGNTITPGAHNIDLSAVDTSTIRSEVEASALSVAVGKKATSVSVGASIARNQINNDIQAFVDNADELRAIGNAGNGNINIHAMETAIIESSSIASAISVGASAAENAISFAGGLATATNHILGKSNAGIKNSEVFATGNLDIDGLNSSTIDAIVKSTSVSVGLSLGANATSGSIGISIARNFIADEPFAYNTVSFDNDQFEYNTEQLTADLVETGDRVRLSEEQKPGFGGLIFENIGADRTSFDLAGEVYNLANGWKLVDNIQSLRAGDIVKLDKGYDDTKGDPGELYRFVDSAVLPGESLDVDIGLEDYNNTARWELVEKIDRSTPLQVHAFIQDSNVDVDGFVELDASSTADIKAIVNAVSVAVAGSAGGNGTSLTGAGIFTENKIATSIKAFVDGVLPTATVDGNTLSADGANTEGKGLSINAKDDSTIEAKTLAASVGASLGTGNATAVSIGLSLALNTIDNEVAATIMDMANVDVDHAVLVNATSEADITSESFAASVAVAIGTGGNAAAVSGGAALAFNTILSSTNALIQDSVLDVGTVALMSDVDVLADSTANITAQVIASSGAVSFGSSNAAGVSVGAAVARNLIGWESTSVTADNTTNESRNGLDANDNVTVKVVDGGARDGNVYQYIGSLQVGNIDLADEDYGNTDKWRQVNLQAAAAETQATIRNSSIEATGDLTVQATGSETIDALALAGSVGVAGGGSTGVGVSVGGTYTENRIKAFVKAIVDGDERTNHLGNEEGIVAKSVTLKANDAASIRADSAAASIAGGFGGTNGVAVSIGVSVALNEVSNEVEAFIRNADSATGVKSTVGNIIVEADVTPAVLPAPALDTSIAGDTLLSAGDKVSVLSNHLGGGEVERIYIYRGAIADYSVLDNSSGSAVRNTDFDGDGFDGVANDDNDIDDEKDNDALLLHHGNTIEDVDGKVYRYSGNDIDLYLGDINFASDGRFTEVNLDERNLSIQDFSDTKLWELGDATILARSAAASVAASGGGTTGVAVSGAGAISLNTILTKTNAFVHGSTLDSAADIDLDAQNTSKITAIVAAASIAVTGGGTTGVGASIGLSVARNVIGFDIASDRSPAEVQAYVEESKVTAIGSLTMDAISKTAIDSVVLAGSAAVAIGGTAGVAVSGAGAISINQIATDVKAYIDGDDELPGTGSIGPIMADNVSINADDDSSIRTVAGAVSVAAAFGGTTGVAVSVGVAIAVNEIDNDIAAFIEDDTVTTTDTNSSDSNIKVNAKDNASIDAISAAASVAIAGGGGGGGIAVSGAGAVANNVILTAVNAHVTNSTLTSAGGVDLDAMSTSTIRAIVAAASAAVGVDGTAGVGVSVGFALVRNFIGWDRGGSVIADYDSSAQQELITDGDLVKVRGGVHDGDTYRYVGENQDRWIFEDTEGTRTLNEGDVVKVSSGRTGENADGDIASIPEGLYRYIGDDGDSVNLTNENYFDDENWNYIDHSDLSAQDFSNRDLWQQVDLVDDAAEIQAYVLNSDVSADDALTADATSDQTIEALTLAGSVAVGGGGTAGVAVAGAGAATENKIKTNVKAYIEGEKLNGISAGSIGLNAHDTSSIRADTVAASVAAAVGGTAGVAVSFGVAVSVNELSNEVEAFIRDTVNVTTTSGNIVIDASVMPGAIPAPTLDSDLGQTSLNAGDKVLVKAGHTEGGEEGRIYQYRGAVADYTLANGADFDDDGFDGTANGDNDLDEEREEDSILIRLGNTVQLANGDVYRFEGNEGTLYLGNINFASDNRFVQVDLDARNLSEQDFTDTKLWELGDTSVTAHTAAASLAAAGGAYAGVAVSGAGAIALNTVLTKTNAFIENSTIVSAANLDLDASNTSRVAAVVAAASVAIGGGVAGVGVSIGFSTARNVIGFDIAGRNPVDVQAYVAESQVTATGSLTANAVADASIDAIVLAGSVAASGGAVGVSVAGAGVIAINQIATNVASFIDGDTDDDLGTGVTGTIIADNVTLGVNDSTSINAIAGAASIAAAFGGTAVAVTVGVSTAVNEISNELEAYIANDSVTTTDAASNNSDIIISATDTANIFAVSSAVSVAIAGGGSGAVSVSGAGAVANNIILTKVNAHIDNSVINSAGNVDLDALSTATIRAIVAAASASIAIDGTAGIGASVGFTLVRNFIGWSEDGGSPDFDTTAVREVINTGDEVKVVGGVRDGDVYEYVGRADDRWKFEDNLTSQSIDATDRVKVSAGKTGDGGRPIQEGIYEYIGDDNTTLNLTTEDYLDEDEWLLVDFSDLSAQDFGDRNLWKQTNLVEQPAEVQAYVLNSDVDADDKLTLDSVADETIEALALAGSVAVAGGGTVGVAVSGAGVGVENRIKTLVRSFIDGEKLGGDGISASDIELRATDTSLIRADAAAASIAASVGGIAGVSVSIGIAVSLNEISNQVEAFILNANDVIATSGDVILNAVTTAGDVDPADNSSSGTKALVDGETVQLSANYANGGEGGRIYKYRGYADFVSTDANRDDDTRTEDLDEEFELGVEPDHIVKDLDSGLYFKFVGTEAQGEAITNLGTINFASSGQWQLLTINLATEDYSNTENWELADAALNARTAAASLAASFGGGAGVAVSGAGAIALNIVKSQTNAYIEGSTLKSAGKVDIDASNSGSISAIVGAASAAVGVGTVGVGVSIGIAIARNFIGFDFDGSEAPATVQSYIMNSSIDAIGALTLDSSATQLIDSVVLSGSVAIAGGGLVGAAASGAGVWAQNEIGVDVKSYIDGDLAGSAQIPEGIKAGNIALNASDDSTINAIGGAASVAVGLGIGGAGVALSIGVALGKNVIASEVMASISNADVTSLDDIIVKADEDATINSFVGAASLAVGAGQFAGVGVSGAGAESTNIILTKTNAFVENSNLISADRVDIDAINSSTINAIVVAASAAVGVGAVGVGASIGVSVARNLVGYTLDFNGAASFDTLDEAQALTKNSSTVEIVEGVRAGDVFKYIGDTVDRFNFSSNATSVTLVEADEENDIAATRVRVLDDFTGTDEDTKAGIYQYTGSGDSGVNLRNEDYDSGDWEFIEPLNLTSQDFSNTDLWEQVNLQPAPAEVQAYIKNSTVDAVGALTLDANGTQEIDAIVIAASAAISGGAVGVSVSGAGVGVENRISSTVKAYIEDDNLVVDFNSNQTPSSIETGDLVKLRSDTGGGKEGFIYKYTGATTLSNLNLSNENFERNNSPWERIAAVEASSVDLLAKDSSTIIADAGAAALSAAFGGVGVAVSVGVAVAVNDIDNVIEASIENVQNGVSATNGKVEIEAMETAVITARTEAAALAFAVGGIGVALSGAGAVATNDLGTSTTAHITNSFVETRGSSGANDINVKATGASTINSFITSAAAAASGGAVAFSGSVGSSVAINKIGGEVKAFVQDSTLVAGDDVSITATATDTINSVASSGSAAFAVGIGAAIAAAGVGVTNTFSTDVFAFMSNSDAMVDDNLTINATANSSTGINSATGVAISASVVGLSVGISVVENTINNDVQAYIEGAADHLVMAGRDILITANSDASLTGTTATTASVAAGLIAVSGGGVGLNNTISNNVLAKISGPIEVVAGRNVEILADDFAAASAFASQVSVAIGLGAALGVSVVTNVFANTVESSVTNANIQSANTSIRAVV